MSAGLLQPTAVQTDRYWASVLVRFQQALCLCLEKNFGVVTKWECGGTDEATGFACVSCVVFSRLLSSSAIFQMQPCLPDAAPPRGAGTGSSLSSVAAAHGRCWCVVSLRPFCCCLARIPCHFLLLFAALGTCSGHCSPADGERLQRKSSM